MPASQQARNLHWSKQLPPRRPPPPAGWSGRAPCPLLGPPFLHFNSPALCSPPPWASFPLNRVTRVPYTCLTASAGLAFAVSVPVGRRPLCSLIRGSLGEKEKSLGPLRGFRGTREPESLQLSADFTCVHR